MLNSQSTISLTKTGTDGASKQIEITNLTNGVEYTIALTTTDTSGNAREQARTESATPLAPSLAPPNAPVLIVTPEDHRVTLTWSAPAGGTKVAGYRIYRRDDAVMNAEFTLLTSGPQPLPAGIHTYTDAPVQNSASYTYRIHAVNANGIESANATGNTDTGQKSPHFYLHANGLTILCPLAANGAEGVIRGVRYTKRTRSGMHAITADNAARSCTSSITDMSSLISAFPSKATFNADISHWDTSRVTNMNSMFDGAADFDQNIGRWNVAMVTNMSSMFSAAADFNKNIGGWNVAKVTDMSSMFHSATVFDQNIGSWNVAKVTDMSNMFQSATHFDQNIGRWNVAMVTNMIAMFFNAGAFNQNLSGWRPLCISGKPTNFDARTIAGFFEVTNRQPTWNTSPPATCT